MEILRPGALLLITLLGPDLFGLSLELQPNLGQAQARYRFLARQNGVRVYIEDTAISFVDGHGREVRLGWEAAESLQEGAWTASVTVDHLIRYCSGPYAEGSLCTAGVPTYRRIVRTRLYPGIDWAIYGRDGRLEYDLIINPGANAQQARLRVSGARSILKADGRLYAGPLVQWRPVAYQLIAGERREVASALREIEPGLFAFDTGGYRHDLPLIIDPVLEAGLVEGGGDEDRIVGISGSYRCGTTRSADWSRSGRPGRDVFVRYDRGFGSATTTFWGGEGDEELGGWDGEANNQRLMLAGWTNSRTASEIVPSRGPGSVGGYRGGMLDGFLLAFAHGTIYLASYVGGPGADRLLDVRRIGDYSALIAGETDNTSWPDATVRKVGQGGDVDAVSGTWAVEGMDLVTLGGAGADRAVRVRAAGPESWIVAGETDSANFPTTSPSLPVSGRDLWLGQFGFDPPRALWLRLWGGKNDERLAGLVWVAEQGLYLAGTTDSLDLPAASSEYAGGPSDGFIAHLDPADGTPKRSTYLGGPGRDEIATLAEHAGGVYLGGASDSAGMNLPGIGVVEMTAGGMDALFVYCDASAAPILAHRVGGSREDRVLALELLEAGVARLAGASDSGTWLRELSPWGPVGGGVDGFHVTLRFATIELDGITTPAQGLRIGNHLQAPIRVRLASEPGMDRIFIARSSDPSKLLLSDQRDLLGRGEIAVAELNEPRFLYLQALSDEGEVEVIFQGRPGLSPTYPERRLRVHLAPARLFAKPIEGSREILQSVNVPFPVSVFSAALLDDGFTPGVPQEGVPGFGVLPALASSDPTALRPEFVQDNRTGEFQIRMVALRDGVYTLTPTSARLPTAPGQQIVVRTKVDSTPPSGYQLAQDFLMLLPLSVTAGDTIRIIAEEPHRLLVRLGNGAWQPSLIHTVPAGASTYFYVLALANQGISTLRIDGMVSGRPLNQTVRFRLIPYQFRLNGSDGVTIPMRAQFILSVTATPAVVPAPEAAGFVADSQTLRNDSLLIAVGATSSNRDVLALVSSRQFGNDLFFTFQAGGIGSATLAFRDVRRSVRVEAPRLEFGPSPFLVPAGTAVVISPTRMSLDNESARNIRVRVSDARLFRLRIPDPVTEVIWNPIQWTLLVEALGQPGQEAALLFAAPGVPEFALPLRTTEVVLAPNADEYRVTQATQPNSLTALSFSLRAHVPGQFARTVVFPSSGYVYRGFRATVRVIAQPPGVCSFPETVELDGNGLSIPFFCPMTGDTTVRLQPAQGISAAQSGYTVRVISEATLPARPFAGARVLTGNGLQTELGLFPGQQRFDGTLRSTDPARVRLAVAPNQPGREMVTSTDARGGSVYIQGYDSTGSVKIIAESNDGTRSELPVYLFPATLALRPRLQYSSESDNALLELIHPVGEPALSVNVRPALVEPVTGSLIFLSSGSLSLRGGTDPLFLRGQSSNADVAESVPPNALVGEGAPGTQLNFRVKAAGETVLSVNQPPGFVAARNSGLRLRTFEQELTLGGFVSLGSGLQTRVATRPRMAASSATPVDVTITSLDPAKLLISAGGQQLGSESVTVRLGVQFYLQALSGLSAGETVQVQMSAPGYTASTERFDLLPVELQTSEGLSVVRINPGQPGSVYLRYGPIDPQGRGRIASSWSGGLLPGTRLPLRLAAADPTVVEVPSGEVELNSESSVALSLRPLRPGRTEVSVAAPEGVVNRVDRLAVEVDPWQFSEVSTQNGSRFLVSRLSFRNPRDLETAVTIRSTGLVPLLVGTSASGPGAPAQSAVTISVPPRNTRELFVQPDGEGASGALRLTAVDFRDFELGLFLGSPQISFEPTGFLSPNLSSGAATIALVLGMDAGGLLRELPLGASIGAVQVELRSSNGQIVRVPPTSVEFRPGDSRKTVALELVGRGDAVVTLIAPAGFNEPARSRNLLITVR